jgi:2-dehydro-3-deoxyphosphogluconate aldolase/(4S)-4-hydroxy-2-oxoglutarate aldolase
MGGKLSERRRSAQTSENGRGYIAPLLSVDEAFPNRLVGVVRSNSPDTAFKACLAAIEGGMGSVEVTMGVPDCFDIVRGLTASTHDVPVGVGTVWDPGSVKRAKQVGASFIVTPVILEDVAVACKKHDILCVMGALTPSEIYQARLAGADLVKVFPVASMGGPEYLRYLAGPMPGLPLWVSGGVQIEDVAEYARLGVRAIGLTTALFTPESMAHADMAGIRERARRAAASVAVVNAVRV